jgi:KamA family protein
MRNRSVQLKVTSPRGAGGAVAEFLDEHGERIADVAMRCDDLEKTLDRADAAGVRTIVLVHLSADRVPMAVVKGFGSVRHTLDTARPGRELHPPAGYSARSPPLVPRTRRRPCVPVTTRKVSSSCPLRKPIITCSRGASANCVLGGTLAAMVSAASLTTAFSYTSKYPKMRSIQGGWLANLTQLKHLNDDQLRRDITIVSAVLPFKVNNYVVDELIDWDAAPDDPIFRLTFPHRDMLPEDLYKKATELIDSGVDRRDLKREFDELRKGLNPHPGGQLDANVPIDDDMPLRGLQHKYRETVLVFPSQGQTCHAYCGYCFRWAQFVGIEELKQAVPDYRKALDYLQQHPEVSDVLFTGGDPLIMSTARLAGYVAPLLKPEFEHVRNIRLGTKALSYWPYRFTTDNDSADLLRLLEQCVKSGRHIAVMAHFSHPQELRTSAVRTAIRLILSTGAVIRAQAPIVRHVNDNVEAWTTMWREMVRLGIVPYYMFVERDTGARNYFEVPLHRALDIYRNAFSSVSGLERTARGPVMSAAPGKVVLDGVTEVAGERVFVCRFLQARDPAWVGRPFFAQYNEAAMWFNDLIPADGRDWFWRLA